MQSLRLCLLSLLVFFASSWKHIYAQEPASSSEAGRMSGSEKPQLNIPTTLNQNLASGAPQSQSESEAPYAFGLSLVHYYGFRGEIDPFSVLNLSGSWDYLDYSFSLSQSLTKYYFVYDDDSELQAADTIIGVSRKFANPIYGFTAASSFSLTLPFSEFSQRQNLYTKPRVGLSLTRAFFDEKLSYTLGGGFQYNLSEYTTTKTSIGAGGGRPLRQYSWSIDNILNYKVLGNLSAAAQISYVRVKYWDIGYKNRVSTATDDALLNTDYSVDLSASYKFHKNFALKAGYSQSDVVEKTGGITEAYLFDVYTTQWYLGLSSSF